MSQNHKTYTIAFDVQGILLGTESKEDSEAMRLLIKRLKKAGHRIIVWTGGTKEDAESAVNQLELNDYVDECRSKLGGNPPDIAFDDMSGNIAKIATIKI